MLTEEEKLQIEELDECKLYFTIDGIGGIVWRTNHDISHDRYEMTEQLQKDINHLLEYQQECLHQLVKFGIDPESAKDRVNGDYWKWYKHWNNWKEGMSDEVWRALERKMKRKEDISDMLPKTKWNE